MQLDLRSAACPSGRDVSSSWRLFRRPAPHCAGQDQHRISGTLAKNWSHIPELVPGGVESCAAKPKEPEDQISGNFAHFFERDLKPGDYLSRGRAIHLPCRITPGKPASEAAARSRAILVSRGNSCT